VTSPVGRLATVRKAAGLSQVELARRMGVGQTRVSAIENAALDTLTVATLTAYLEAVGDRLRVVTASGYLLRDVD
jgi:transcriptional regulator with XRE-family HTH domain